MIIFDFISQDEIEDLPDDDPHTAFATFVKIAQRRLNERIKEIDTNDHSGWEEVNEARHGFMNVVIAAAKKYQIEQLASLSVPRIDNFDNKAHRQFKADLDHYLTQLLLDNSSRSKRESVFISTELKNTIRTYIHHLKKAIENADDLSEARRNALLRKLADFEAELEKKRLNLLAVTVLAITVLSAPGGLGATADIAIRLINNVLRVVGEAKLADDETRRLSPSTPPIAISGPRKDDSALTDKCKGQQELDNDIPF